MPATESLGYPKNIAVAPLRPLNELVWNAGHIVAANVQVWAPLNGHNNTIVGVHHTVIAHNNTIVGAHHAIITPPQLTVSTKIAIGAACIGVALWTSRKMIGKWITPFKSKID